MDNVLVLIASPSSRDLTPEIVTTAAASLNITGEPVWLDPGIACEFPVTLNDGTQQIKAEMTVRKALAGARVDVAVLPAENRRKKLLVADMDSTIIAQECIDELADIAGVGDKIRDITARAMAGELDFEQALKARLCLLSGQPEGIIDEVIATRISLNPGARELVRTMKAHGAVTALISGGFNQFTAHVAKLCGFDEHNANTLEIRNGKLTGQVIGPIIGQQAKLRAIGQLTMMNGLTFGQTMAVGDGANDIPMLKRAGLGVAHHGKPAVRDAARVSINHADLTALLYLQGYRRDEFAAPEKPAFKITTSP